MHIYEDIHSSGLGRLFSSAQHLRKLDPIARFHQPLFSVPVEEGKETKEKLMMKAKRQRISGKDVEEERDKLSDLPDCVLLHIMKFMDTRHAVQTCVLSKRWKELWKHLTSFSFGYCKGIHSYNKFLSRLLSFRDDSISLLNLNLMVFRSTEHSKLLKKVIEHASSHNLQRLKITTDFRFKKIPNSFVPLIFRCQSLTFLELSISPVSILELPKSLLLPSLKSLHLTNVSFTTTDSDCAEPFSTCNSLNTLVLQHSMRHDAKVLCISNSNLSSLKLDNIVNWYTFQPKIVLSTPNLTSITIVVGHFLPCHELSSTCDLPFLEEVNIDTCAAHMDSSVIISWLQMLSNVKILTLSSYTLDVLLKGLSNLAAMKIQPPCFVRLESLKIKMGPCSMISDDEVKKTVEYLLQNSPPTRVAVI